MSCYGRAAALDRLVGIESVYHQDHSMLVAQNAFDYHSRCQLCNANTEFGDPIRELIPRNLVVQSQLTVKA